MKKSTDVSFQTDFKSFYHKAAPGIGVYDPTGTIISYNEIAASHLGGKPEDFTGKNILQIFPEKEASIYLKRLKEAMDAEGSVNYEDRMNIGSGDQWFYSTYSKFQVNGNSPCIQIVSQDITDLKIRELQHKANEDKFKAIFDLAFDPVFICSLKGDFIEVNEMACKELGYSLDEFKKMNIQDVSTYLKYSELKDVIQEIREKGSQKFEIIQCCKNGENFIAEIDSRIIQLSGTEAVLSVSRLVSKENHQDLYRSLLISIVESTDDGIESMDIDGNILSWNHGAEKIYGYAANEIIGKNALNLFSKDSKNELKENLTTIKSGESIHNQKTKRKHKNGKLIDVAISYSPIKNSKGKISAVSVITRDISEQVKHRQQLRENELKYQTIFDDSSEGILLMTKQGIIDCNKQLCLMLGYTKEELLGKSPVSFSPDYQDNGSLSLDLGAQHIQKALDEGYHQFEWQHKKKDEKTINVQISLKRIMLGESKVLLTIIHDLSDIFEYQKSLKEKNEEILAQNEEYQVLNEELNGANERLQIVNKHIELSEYKFRTAFKISPDAININRLSDGLYLEINDGFTQLTGYTEQDVKDKTSNDIDIWLTKKDRSAVIKELKKNGLLANQETRFLRKDGSVTTGLMSASLIEINDEKCILSITRDISERKALEEILQKNEQQFRQLVEETHAISWEYNIVDDQWTYVSPQSKTILEIEPEEWTNLDFWVNNLHPEDKDWASKYCLECTLKEKNHTLEYRFKTKKGDYVWLRDVVSVETGDSGPVFLRGVMIDITETKHAQETVQQQERYLRTILQANQEGFWIVNIKGNILDANSAYLEMSGYSRKELLQLGINDINAIETIEITQARIESVMSKGSALFETKHKRKDGSLFDIEVSITYLDISGGQFICFGRDITAKKQAEEEIRKLSKGIDQSPAICVITDLEGTIEYVNPKFTELTGYSAEEVIGKNPRILKSEYHSKKFYTELWDTIQSGNDFRCEMRNKKKNGDLYWESALISPVKNDHGVIKNFIAIKEDITEKKKAEEEIKELNFRTNLATDAAMIGIWDFDLTQNKMLWDDHMFMLYGVRRGHYQESYAAWQEALHPEDRSRVVQESEDAILNKDEFHTSFRVIWPDKTIKHIQAHAKVIHDKKGKALRMTGVNWDITNNVERENELRIKDFAIQSSVSAIGFADLNGFMSYVNEAFLDLWGYQNLEEVLGKHIFEFGNVKGLSEYISSIINEDSSYSGEVLATRKDGSQFYGEVSANLIKTADGKPLYIMASFLDITKRKKAEKELQHSLIRNKALLNAHPDLMFVFSDEGTIIDYKAESINDLYADPSVFIGQNVREALPPHLASLTLEMIDKVKRLNKLVEYSYSLNMGLSTKYYNCRMLSYGDDKFVAVVRDITKLKSDELKIRENAQKLKDAQRIAKLTNWGFDHIQNKMEWSEESIHIFETKNEIKNLTYASLLEFVHPDDRKKVEKAFLDSLKNKKPYEMNHRIITAKGNLKFVKEKYRTSFDKLGNPVKTVGIIQDITDLKEIEKDLIKAKEKAEESDRLKSAFLANMSHEIRTPMNAIRGFAQLLVETQFSKEKLKRFLNIINSRSQDLLIIIDDIIDISKIEANQLKILESEFALNKLLREMYSNKEIEIQNGINSNLKLQLKIGLPKEQAFIRTDESRVKQVLINLLNNALKFTETGIIEFGYKLNDNSFLEFYVKDTGIGIPEEAQQLIFERFRQVDDSSTRKYGGTGLGLHICRQILKLLGGDIWVESKLGKGSTFFFTIPYLPSSEKDQILEENLKFNWENKKVLIVEDDSVNMYYLCELLELTKISILEAADGEEALEKINKERNLDLVLLDINLPGKSGNEIIKHIRKINKTIPVIAQSAYSMPEEIKKSMTYGFNDYITKPIDSKLLFSLMNKYLSK